MSSIGLTSIEAQRRLAETGPNILVAPIPNAWIGKWARRLLDPMVVLLIGAAIIYLLLGEMRDAIALIAAIVPILVVDVVLDTRSDKALNKIKELSAKMAVVVRDGKEIEVPSESLVLGDLMVLKEGDIIAADAELMTSNNLEVDESALTGESVPVAKDSNSETGREVFGGTAVLSGQGLATVTLTGARTRYGQIGVLMSEIKEEPTPLQKKMNRLLLSLLAIAVVGCIAMFAAEFLRGAGLGKSLLSTVSLAIAAIPEEFPVVFTLYLTMGVFRLARKKALVRHKAGVETLGSTTVICVDKTGTLTEGRLAYSEHLAVVDEQRFWQSVVMACEPRPTDSLEIELMRKAAEYGVIQDQISNEYRLVKDYPFDIKEKYMSHVWESKNGERLTCSKGAVETILKHCKSPQTRESLSAASERLARMGMRVIGFACGKAGESTIREENERELDGIGLVAFLDPPRGEAPAAIRDCQRAGIRVLMLTGDHPLTARHVAQVIGLQHTDDQVVTGPELEVLNDEAFGKRVKSARIFARVFPHHKLRLVRALKAGGDIVAMTGDGINDALALKESHIGIAMGIRGTEVAREASTMVLLDDNFGTIVDAIREGRRVFSRMEKAFRYLVTFHIPIILLAVLAPALGLPLVFPPLIIIWLELIMHPTVALVFENDKGDPDAMKKPPRDPSVGILTLKQLLASTATGLVIGIALLGLYAFELSHGMSEPQSRMMAIAALLISEVVMVTLELVRSNRIAALKNTFFWVTRTLSLAVLLVFIYYKPLYEVMQLAPIGVFAWLWVIAIAIASTLLVEMFLMARRELNRQPGSKSR